ncbi:hypothetical protein N9E22_01955 [Burkholderiales bacterium]|nr:hypothetical protein [Burkholderiales bacterium]
MKYGNTKSTAYWYARRVFRNIPVNGRMIGMHLRINQEPSGFNGAIYPSQARHHRLIRMIPPLEKNW